MEDQLKASLLSSVQYCSEVWGFCVMGEQLRAFLLSTHKTCIFSCFYFIVNLVNTILPQSIISWSDGTHTSLASLETRG